MNVVVLRGTLSRAPEEQELPSGTRLVRYELTMRSPEHGAETAPVAWFDAPAGATAFARGDEVLVTGRVRRRWFRRAGVTESRIEVTATEVVAARRKSRVRQLVERTAAVLAEP